MKIPSSKFQVKSLKQQAGIRGGMASSAHTHAERQLGDFDLP